MKNICNIKIKDFLLCQYAIYGPVRVILTSEFVFGQYNPTSSSVNIILTGPYITYWPRKKSIIDKYYIWCGFRTISLAKSVTWYTEYLMYFFHCEETRLLVSIFTYIDAMLLNLEAPVPQQTKRKFVDLSVLKNFIKFQIFQKISKFKNFNKKKLKFKI